MYYPKSLLATLLIAFLFVTGAAQNDSQAPALAEAQTFHLQSVRLYNEGRYSEAIAPAKKALELREKALGQEHELVKMSLSNLAMAFRANQQIAEADPLFRRTLKLEEKLSGAESPKLYPILIQYGWCRYALLFAADAESAFKRALAIKEKEVGNESADLIEALSYVASLYQKMGKPAPAIPLHKRILALLEKKHGAESPLLIEPLEKCNCAFLQNKQLNEAKPYFDRMIKLAASKRADAKGIQDIAGGVLTGYALHKQQPSYPDYAKAARVEGTVIVKITIDETGTVSEALPMCGHDYLMGGSLAAAKLWKFTPTSLAGQPVKVQGYLTFNFVLR